MRCEIREIHRGPSVELRDRRRRLAATGPTNVNVSMPAAATAAANPARQVELLDRGVIAINKGSGNVYVGWRLLGTDPSSIAFNVYRSTNGAAPLKRNASPITASTNVNDTGVNLAADNAYFVRPVIDG